MASVNEPLTHTGIERRDAQRVAKQVSVDVRGSASRSSSSVLTRWSSGVLSTWNNCASHPPRSDPSSRVRFSNSSKKDVTRLENAGVVRKETEDDADEELLQVVAGVT